MDSKQARNLLDEYLRGELDSHIRGELEHLLEKDEELRKARDELRSYLEKLDSLPSIEASDSFLENVHAKVKRRRFPLPIFPLEIAGVALTVGLLILIVNPFNSKVQNESRVVQDLIEAETLGESQIVPVPGASEISPPTDGSPATIRSAGIKKKTAKPKTTKPEESAGNPDAENKKEKRSSPRGAVARQEEQLSDATQRFDIGDAEKASQSSFEATADTDLNDLSEMSYARNLNSSTNARSRQLSKKRHSKTLSVPVSAASVPANSGIPPGMTVRLDKDTDLTAFSQLMHDWAKQNRGHYRVTTDDSSQITARLRLPPELSVQVFDYIDSLGTITSPPDSSRGDEGHEIEIRIRIVTPEH